MSGPLVEGRQLVGAPVVDLRTGDDVAEIRDVVFDPRSGSLTGFTLNKPAHGFWARLTAGRMREVLVLGDVVCVGPHAVMVQRADVLVDPSADGAGVTAAHEVNADVSDDRVVTEAGRELGRVTDVVIATGTEPRVVGYRVDAVGGGERLVPLQAQRAISGDALIVPEDYERRLHDDLGGLAAEIRSLEEAAR